MCNCVKANLGLIAKVVFIELCDTQNKQNRLKNKVLLGYDKVFNFLM